jgi:hypothetical protein
MDVVLVYKESIRAGRDSSPANARSRLKPTLDFMKFDWALRLCIKQENHSINSKRHYVKVVLNAEGIGGMILKTHHLQLAKNADV